MGRHSSNGIDYFNIDVIQEDNLNYIEAKHGLIGYGVVVKLWRKIYMVEGYYTDWSEKNQYLFSKEIGVPVEEINEILDTCFQEGIFSNDMYVDHTILTSSGVQKRWVKIVTEARRKNREIDPKFRLIDKTPEFLPKTQEESPKTHAESTQTKVKESKVKEIEENTGAHEVPTPPPPSSKKFVKPTQQQLQDYFILKMCNPKSPGYWPPDRCQKEAAKMFDHYTTNGWVQGKNKPIKDWEAACRNWIRNCQDGTFESRSFQASPPAPLAPIVNNQPPTLEKIAEECNYLYEMYLEDKCTVISVLVPHFNYMKRKLGLEFTEEEKLEIQKLAIEKLQGDGKPVNDTSLIEMMKKFGVLHFFKEKKRLGAQTIFENQKIA